MKSIKYQNRFRRFSKLEKYYEQKTGKKLNINYEKMFEYVPVVKPEKLVLDADQMLMILVYVLL